MTEDLLSCVSRSDKEVRSEGKRRGWNKEKERLGHRFLFLLVVLMHLCGQKLCVFSVLSTDFLSIPIDALFGSHAPNMWPCVRQREWDSSSASVPSVSFLCVFQCVCKSAVMLAVYQCGLCNLFPLQHYHCCFWTASLHTTVTNQYI